MTSRHIKRLLIGLLLGLAISSAQAARITDKLLAGLYESPDATTTPSRVLPSDTPLERLEKQGDFTKVRMGDGTEGWVESRFITDEKPARIMLLELQVKNSELQQKLRDANRELKALGQTPSATTPDQPDPEIAELKRQLADAKAEIELLKRESATQAAPPPQKRADTKLKQQVTALQQELEQAKRSAQKASEQQNHDDALKQLRQTNEQLQQKLGQIAEVVGVQNNAALSPETPAEPEGFRLNAWHLPVFMLALLLSFIGGVAFKNYRLAKRYGGFRI
jgi:hypothetical protein